MDQTAKWFSPKTTSGSFLLAFAAHGALFGVVVLLLSLGILKFQADAVPMTEEIAYETFSEPPTTVPAVKVVARVQPEEVQEKTNERPDNSPKEIQDTKSDIAGAQAAAPKQQVATAGASSSAGDPNTPYYKIKPKYPRAALAAGVEGWVLIKVDINEKGDVENLRVVGGQERSMFQDEARRAVEKWKYKPFVDSNGKVIHKADHEVRVDFKLRDAV